MVPLETLFASLSIPTFCENLILLNDWNAIQVLFCFSTFSERGGRGKEAERIRNGFFAKLNNFKLNKSS